LRNVSENVSKIHHFEPKMFFKNFWRGALPPFQIPLGKGTPHPNPTPSHALGTLPVPFQNPGISPE